MAEKLSFKKLEHYNQAEEGSSYVGEIYTTLVELVQLLGAPSNKGDDYKIEACWELEFSDGTFASIYNWKTGRGYDQENGQNIFDITCWHVRGASDRAVDLVEALFSTDEEVDID